MELQTILLVSILRIYNRNPPSETHSLETATFNSCKYKIKSNIYKRKNINLKPHFDSKVLVFILPFHPIIFNYKAKLVKSVQDCGTNFSAISNFTVTRNLAVLRATTYKGHRLRFFPGHLK